MHRRLLILACACWAPVALAQQPPAKWQFGATVSMPTRILDVNSGDFPDSNSNRVNLGIGIGVNATRSWAYRSKAVASIVGRATFATVNSFTGGEEWSPGHVTMIDVSGRLSREVSPRIAVFGGLMVSHWFGPGTTAPFSGLGPILVGSEAGLTVKPSTGTWLVDFTANATRLGADDDHQITGGFVWRLMMGLRRAR